MCLSSQAVEYSNINIYSSPSEELSSLYFWATPRCLIIEIYDIQTGARDSYRQKIRSQPCIHLVPNQLLLLSTALCPILEMLTLCLPFLLLQLSCQFSALLGGSIISLLAGTQTSASFAPLQRSNGITSAANAAAARASTSADRSPSVLPVS